MKQWRGLWFPDSERHLIDWMATNLTMVGGRPAYQYAKYERALALLPAERRRVAVDVGANVGLWSRVMLLDFAAVWAFEPVPEHIECLKLNAPEAFVQPIALGEAQGVTDLINTTPGSCGDTRIVATEGTETASSADHVVELYPLDYFVELTSVDLVKIDCEGYEEFVVRGAVDTLRRCKPVVIVEQKPGHASKAYGLDDQGARKFLESIGMRVHAEMSGDFIMRW
jgi:FkbM family methyltransferase